MRSKLRHLELAELDLLDEGVWWDVLDGAADGLGGAEDLADGSRGGAGHRARAELLGDGEDVVVGDVAAVRDVLHLLAVARGLLEGADDEGGRARHDLDLGLPVLDEEVARDLQALPVLGGLLDVVADLLRGQTEGAELGAEGTGADWLTADAADDELVLCVWVELWRHWKS